MRDRSGFVRLGALGALLAAGAAVSSATNAADVVKAGGLKVKAQSFVMPAVEPGAIIECRQKPACAGSGTVSRAGRGTVSRVGQALAPAGAEAAQ